MNKVDDLIVRLRTEVSCNSLYEFCAAQIGLIGRNIFFLSEGHQGQKFICPNCADVAYWESVQELRGPNAQFANRLVDYDTNDEDDDMYCDMCNEQIPAQYGEEECDPDTEVCGVEGCPLHKGG